MDDRGTLVSGGKTLEVFAKKNSIVGGELFKTGISIKPGQLLVVTVKQDEKWSVQEGSEEWTSNANGCVGKPWLHNGLQAFIGALVGTFDNGNTYFGIGTLLEMTMVVRGSELCLGCWDTAPTNNSGAVHPTVAVYTGPQ